MTVAVAAEAATEAPEQEDDEDDDKYESNRHDLSPVTTPTQTFVASSRSDCEALVWHFPDDALRLETGVAQQHDLVVTRDFLETAFKQLGRIFVVNLADDNDSSCRV